jgi:inner membrane protein
MDNLTHSLVGVLLARAGLNRLAPRVTPLVVIAANAPDFDIVTGTISPLAYLEHHRGWSHSVVVAPLIALALLPIWWLWTRKLKPPPSAWRGAWLAALAGSLSNPLLDLPNVYGTKFLLPWRSDWLHFDFVHIVDLWIWGLLAVAVLGPMLSRLVASEIGARPGQGRTAAWTSLMLLLAFLVVRHETHARALAALDSRLYAGEKPLRVHAFPTVASPWRWQGAVQTAKAWHCVEIDLLQEFDPESARVYYRPDLRRHLESIRQTSTGRVFLDFSQVTLWRLIPAAQPEGAVRVSAHDLRFGLPEEGRFSAYWVLDPSFHVVSESFTMGSGAPNQP